jgi:hypothetical protein
MAMVTISAENVTGAVEILRATSLQIYPNPFTGVVRATGADGCTVRVINTAGVVVHTQTITSADETIQLEHLPVGVYFFVFEMDGKTKTVKVIKE